MLDDLFDLFERDKKHANQRQTGLRGRLSSMLAGAGRIVRVTPGSAWHDDDDDDRDDDRRSARPHKQKREFDPFDFGD